MDARNVPVVWIIGSSLIVKLRSHLINTDRSVEFLGGCRIRWFGMSGMRWEHLRPRLCRMRYRFPAPSVMVIHCGANNIGTVSGLTLLHRMREDLSWIMETYPETRLLFSSMVARRVYRDLIPGRRAYRLEMTRRAVNSGIAAFLADRGHGRISHRNIRHNLDLYEDDGVHLNFEGNEVFLLNFHSVLWHMQFGGRWHASTTSNKHDMSTQRLF